jgi:hypothetical protein
MNSLIREEKKLCGIMNLIMKLASIHILLSKIHFKTEQDPQHWGKVSVYSFILEQEAKTAITS